VSGFHAADPAQVSVHSLVRSLRADEKIEGHRAFRLAGGYQALIDTFREALSRAKVAIQLGTVVHRIGWTKGKVEVRAVNKSAQVVFTGGRVLVTLPLGVLRVPATSGGVAFSPELPGSKNSAIGKLAMGKVVRVILRFEKRFWDEIRPDPKASKTLAEMRF